MIKINEKTHTYTDEKGKKYKSVTTLLGKYAPKFDPYGYIAKAVAKKQGVSVEQIKDMWEKIASDSRDRGKRIHKIIENYILDGIEDPENIELINSFKNLNLKGKLYPEEKIASEDLLIAGTMDLKIDRGNDIIDIFDYKTNKEIDFFSKYKNRLYAPISHLEDCSYNKYALQLSFYAFLCELKSFKIGRLGILWIDENDKIIYYPVPYMKDTIEILIEDIRKKYVDI